MTNTDLEPAVQSESKSQGSSLTELFSGIISDAQLLFKQQVELVRAEFIEDIRRTRQVAQCYGLGILLLTVGLVMMLIAGVHLVETLTGWPMWASWACAGAVSLVLGGICFAVGSRILKSFNLLPDKSFNALQENVTCLTNLPK